MKDACRYALPAVAAAAGLLVHLFARDIRPDTQAGLSRNRRR